MNKNLELISILIIIGTLIAYGLYTYFKKPQISTVQGFDPKNTTYTINKESFTLTNGISKVPITPDSSSMITTRYFGNEVTGDLTGDGLPDRAYLITQETGGSGIFYYAVVAIKNGDTYKLTNAFFIGDRIAPQMPEIHANELHVMYAERNKGEPMTAQPSVGAVTLLKVTKEGVLEGLMK